MTFLHVNNYPASIDVLLALRDVRDMSAIGLTLVPNGLEVDFDALLGSYLSSTEKATVRLVQAVYEVEGRGGLPSRVTWAVRALMRDLIDYVPTCRYCDRVAVPGTDGCGVCALSKEEG